MEELDKHKDKRFFMFVHFADPDHPGHKHGENSRQYTEAIADDDAWTGKIIAKLKELGLYESTLVYVVVDHGFNEGEKGHRYAPYVFLGTNDAAVMRDGDRMDIAPTILKRFGVNLSTLQPALSGKPLDEPAARVAAPAEKPNVPKRPTEAEKAKTADILKSDKPALERLKQVDVEKLTPVQAKRLLMDIKKEAVSSMNNAAEAVDAAKD